MASQKTAKTTNGQCTWKTDGVQCTAEKVRPAAACCTEHVADWIAARDARRAAKGQTPAAPKAPKAEKAPRTKRVPKNSGGRLHLNVAPSARVVQPAEAVARVVHTIGNRPIGTDNPGSYGRTHDFNCPGCVNTSFLASPRSETYWAS